MKVLKFGLSHCHWCLLGSESTLGVGVTSVRVDSVESSEFPESDLARMVAGCPHDCVASDFG